MVKESKSRARNLSDEDIKGIVGILDGWSGKLTWELLIDAISARLKVRYTRQALNQHLRIKQAFQLTKERISGQPKSTQPGGNGFSATEAQTMMDRLARVEAENARLNLENERLMEQFVVWAYNASNRGLDVQYLSQPLPVVDRDQTRRTKK